MKLKDYDLSINVLDAEMASILERMEGLDPTSDEYRKAAESLKVIQESKQIEVRNKSEHLSGKIPGWAVAIGTTVFGTLSAIFFGRKVLNIELEDGVVSSQAINVFDKVIRKF